MPTKSKKVLSLPTHSDIDDSDEHEVAVDVVKETSVVKQTIKEGGAIKDIKEAKKPSYTNRLCLHLLETFEDEPIDKYIDAIKKFSKIVQREIEAKEKEPVHVFPNGKYKNKKISDIGKIDIDYIIWLSRQSSLKPNLKTALDNEIEKNQKKELSE